MSYVKLEDAKKALDELWEFCWLENTDFWKKLDLLKSLPTYPDPLSEIDKTIEELQENRWST